MTQSIYINIYSKIGNFIPLISCLNFTWFIFTLGMVGIVLNRKNILLMLLCIELMFFSLSMNFIFLSCFLEQPLGEIYALFIIATAASETAIGLSLAVIVFRLSGKINYKSLTTLRG